MIWSPRHIQKSYFFFWFVSYLWIVVCALQLFKPSENIHQAESEDLISHVSKSQSKDSVRVERSDEGGSQRIEGMKRHSLCIFLDGWLMELLEFDVDQIKMPLLLCRSRKHRNEFILERWRYYSGVTLWICSGHSHKTHRIKTEIQDFTNLWLHGRHTAFTLIKTLDR